VLLLGRWRGLASLVALGVSFVVLLTFVLPAILDGRNPLAVAVVGSCLIMFAVLYLSHGVSARTSTAVLGTLVSLGLIGVLGAVFVAATDFTGLVGEDIGFLRVAGGQLDFTGLLLAAIIIGSLGVLDDVTVTQVSAVWELHRTDPDLDPTRLWRAALNIGRDHIASTVNTLVLAYVGASLPLLLLFTSASRPLGDVLTAETVAVEVVRAFVGSIGLVASVPITTGLAVLVVRGDRIRWPVRRADSSVMSARRGSKLLVVRCFASPGRTADAPLARSRLTWQGHLSGYPRRRL
ncbi:MAG: YibE/F family protein, partial [Acidimicrobiales bacterium]